ncbi:MAG: nitrous oxide reductase accessory protein NosL [Desulfobacteraceae bacterium]|jgi:nitrous oxide reductase accessory protein NosL
MLKKIRLLVLVLFVHAALMQTVVWAKDYIAPKPKDKCPVCGMFVAKYPKWVAEIVFKDGSYVVFDGCKDMFKYYFNMAKYTKKKSRDDIAEIFVTEYYTVKIHKASEVLFIVGSDVLGPMGHELIPVKGQDEAKIFTLGHGGDKVFRFDEISATDIPK